MTTPEQKEEIRTKAFGKHLQAKSDCELAITLFNITCRLMDKNGKATDFNRGLVISAIRELDYTGEHDISFEEGE